MKLHGLGLAELGRLYRTRAITYADLVTELHYREERLAMLSWHRSCDVPFPPSSSRVYRDLYAYATRTCARSGARCVSVECADWTVSTRCV